MQFTLASIAAFIATAAAIQITSPTKNEDVDLSKGTTIKWSSVSTDPSSFSIYLVNMDGYPNVNKLIADNVKTSDGSYSLKDVSGVSSGSGFQVNFISKDPQSSGILAQSEQFSVKSSSSSTTTGTTTGKTTDATTSYSSYTVTSTSCSTTCSASTSSTTASSSTTPGSSTLGTSTSTSTSSSKASSSGTSTSTSTSAANVSDSTTAPTDLSNGAASQVVPVAAGSILMGLFALVL